MSARNLHVSWPTSENFVMGSHKRFGRPYFVWVGSCFEQSNKKRWFCGRTWITSENATDGDTAKVKERLLGAFLCRC